MGNLFSSPPKPKKVEEPVPSREDAAVEEARRQALIAANARQGRAAQLVTGAQGVTSQVQAQQARLLGA